MAIQTLRNVAPAAEKDGQEQIVVQKLAAQAREMKNTQRVSQLNALAEDHRILYQVLERFGSLTSRGLYDR